MKKTLLSLLSLLLVVTLHSCDIFEDDSDNTIPTDSIVIEDPTIEISANGQTLYLTFKTYLSVSASIEDESWCSFADFTYSSYLDDDTVVEKTIAFEISQNDETESRTNIITLTATTGQTETITIIQSGAESVTYTLATIPEDGISITANHWIITDSEASSYDFDNLIAALVSIYNDNSNEDRNITIEFSNMTLFPEWAFCTYNDFKELWALTYVELPNAISIGSGAFYSCKGLKEVSAPKATAIGNNAFMSLYAFESIDAPNVTVISGYAFYQCESLTEINFPLTTTIGDAAFCSSSISQAIFPSAIYVGTHAFQSCENLTIVEMASITHMDEFPIQAGSPESIIREIRFESLETVGDDFKLYDMTALEIFEAPNLTNLNINMFSGCSSLQYAYFPEATSIGGGAFSWCTSIKEIVLSKIETLSLSEFNGCKSLESIEIPLLKRASIYAFGSCESLKSIDIPLIDTLYEGVFSDCTSLESFSSSATTHVEHAAFYSCESLARVDLPNAKSVSTYCFSNGSALKYANLPSVESVGAMAFANCTSLDSLILASTVTSIEIKESSFGISKTSGATTSYSGSDIDLSQTTLITNHIINGSAVSADKQYWSVSGYTVGPFKTIEFN